MYISGINGLADRDSARWGLSPKMVQRRRILFWDLFVADSWTVSASFSPRPTILFSYVSARASTLGDPHHFLWLISTASSQITRMAVGKAAVISIQVVSSLCLLASSTNLRFLVESWGFRFAAECVAEVASRTLTAEAPSYATIMELDKKVRDFSLPPLPASSSGDQRESFAAEFTRCVLDHTRETSTFISPSPAHLSSCSIVPLVLLYIHRSFFAQAIIDQPVNPLKSSYAYSFLAAYRASSTILKSVKEQFRTWPAASACFWSMWTFAFSAAVRAIGFYFQSLPHITSIILSYEANSLGGSLLIRGFLFMSYRSYLARW